MSTTWGAGVDSLTRRYFVLCQLLADKVEKLAKCCVWIVRDKTRLDVFFRTVVEVLGVCGDFGVIGAGYLSQFVVH